MRCPAPSLVRTMPPSGDVVPLDDLKAFARIDDNDQDEVLRGLLATAIEKLEGPAGYIRQCLLTQEWELRLEGFAPTIPLPLPPVRSVASIAYTAPDGSAATIAGGDVVVIGLGTKAAVIHPPAGEAWPQHRTGPEAVKVRFSTGYGAAADVPSQIRTALMIATVHLFETRDGSGDPFGACKQMLSRFHRPVFA